MPEEQDGAMRTVDLEAEVWNAISAFEQIVEAIPDDRTSLEALAGAYEQIGDLARARDYLLRLAEVYVKAGDAEAAQGLVSRLESYAAGDAHAAELVASVRAMRSRAKPQSRPSRAKEDIVQQRLRSGFNMADGITFAWSLMEHGDLTEADYAAVVQDLTEISVNGGAQTVSVLHVLETRGFKGLERTLTRCAKEWGTPAITLGGFDLQYPVATALPYELVLRCGVLPFEMFGGHYLIVLMSPYDKSLCADIDEILGKPCHYFVTLPSEFDQAVARVATMIEEHRLSAENEAAQVGAPQA
jgi:hypothetical protein